VFASKSVRLGDGTVYASGVAPAYQFAYQVSHPGCTVIATLFDFEGPAFMWVSRTLSSLDSPTCLSEEFDCQFSTVCICFWVFNWLSLPWELIFLLMCTAQFVADDTNPKSVLTISNSSGFYFLRVSEGTVRFKLEVREHCDYSRSRVIDSVSTTLFLFGLGACFLCWLYTFGCASSALFCMNFNTSVVVFSVIF
jgi:hypothetical protein